MYPFESEKCSIGKVIKIIAYVTWILEVISGIITGIGIMFATYDYMWVGIIVIVLSPFFASLSTILLYALGALIDKIYDMRNDTAKMCAKIASIEKILGTQFGIEVEGCETKEEAKTAPKPATKPKEKRTLVKYAFGAMNDKVYSVKEKIDGLKFQKADGSYKEINETTIECCKCHYWQPKRNDTCIKCGSKFRYKL